jgi:hypothetical protein
LAIMTAGAYGAVQVGSTTPGRWCRYWSRTINTLWRPRVDVAEALIAMDKPAPWL